MKASTKLEAQDTTKLDEHIQVAAALLASPSLSLTAGNTSDCHCVDLILSIVGVQFRSGANYL